MVILLALSDPGVYGYDPTASNAEATCKSLGFITSESNIECALKIRQTETETFQLYKKKLAKRSYNHHYGQDRNFGKTKATKQYSSTYAK